MRETHSGEAIMQKSYTLYKHSIFNIASIYHVNDNCLLSTHKHSCWRIQAVVDNFTSEWDFNIFDWKEIGQTCVRVSWSEIVTNTRRGRCQSLIKISFSVSVFSISDLLSVKLKCLALTLQCKCVFECFAKLTLIARTKGDSDLEFYIETSTDGTQYHHWRYETIHKVGTQQGKRYFALSTDLL